ncbi:MAG TPA: diguanylate cyclase [Polyangiales bacterium]|nr:diguanylate cyclase [Polyangiales bacterium]
MQENLTATTRSQRGEADIDRVLYVEDDASLRDAFIRALVRRGIDVDAASNRHEALSLAERNSYPVIVTDLFFSDTDGVSLANELRSVQPDASFIITTGFDVELRGSGGLEDSIACFLKKPWDDQQLTAAVDNARESYRVRRSIQPAASQRYSVLLVDDNAADAYLTTMHLEKGGVCSEIVHCTRLAQAVAMLQARRFDAVIADLGLPDARGLVTVEQVRATAPDAALIVLSGFDDEKVNVQAVRMGAQDYLIKGRVDTELMRRSLQHAIERKRQEQRLSYLAHHDPLTQLINRAAFCNKLEEATANTRRTGRPCAVMFLDLDHFKQVNDVHGHEAGDAVLCEIARRIQASVREEDTVGRLGGDEFAILVGEVDDPQICTRVAARMLEITRVPVLLRDDVHATVQLSVGIALCPDAATTGDALLRAADAAMYIAKAAGGGVHLHVPTSEEADANSERKAV